MKTVSGFFVLGKYRVRFNQSKSAWVIRSLITNRVLAITHSRQDAIEMINVFGETQ